MARAPLVVDCEGGRIYVIDLGSDGGEVILLVEQNGSALTVPLEGAAARAIGSYLRSGVMAPQGRPSATKDIPIEEMAKLYESMEAGDYQGGRTQYVADHYGITKQAAGYRITQARQAGFITGTYRRGG